MHVSRGRIRAGRLDSSSRENNAEHATPFAQRAPAPPSLGNDTAWNDGHSLFFHTPRPFGLPGWSIGCAVSCPPPRVPADAALQIPH